MSDILTLLGASGGGGKTWKFAIYTANATWVCPDVSGTKVHAIVIGGGGGGGSTSQINSPSSGVAGGSGGTSSFGSLASAAGGSGGYPGPYSYPVGTPIVFSTPAPSTGYAMPNGASCVQTGSSSGFTLIASHGAPGFMGIGNGGHGGVPNIIISGYIQAPGGGGASGTVAQYVGTVTSNQTITIGGGGGGGSGVYKGSGFRGSRGAVIVGWEEGAK